MEQTAVCVPKFLEPYRFEPKRLFVVGQDSSSDRTPSTDRARGTSSTIAAEEAGTERREEAYLQLEGAPAERVGNTDRCSCKSCSQMFRTVDCFCCRECKCGLGKMCGLRCITLRKDFYGVWLNAAMLKVCLVGYYELWE